MVDHVGEKTRNGRGDREGKAIMKNENGQKSGNAAEAIEEGRGSGVTSEAFMRQLHKEATSQFRTQLDTFVGRAKGTGSLTKKQADDMTAGFGDGMATMLTH